MNFYQKALFSLVVESKLTDGLCTKSLLMDGRLN